MVLKKLRYKFLFTFIAFIVLICFRELINKLSLQLMIRKYKRVYFI